MDIKELGKWLCSGCVRLVRRLCLPETGELMLGDIVISIEKAKEQADLYGHAFKREFAFLIAHSMLHLLGYDHMEEDERLVMEEKQRSILANLGIER